MTIKTILVPLDGSDSNREVLDAAFRVAQHFGAHVHGLHVLARPTDVAPFMFDRLSEKMRKTFETEVTEDEREKAAVIRAMFEERCREYEVPIVTAPGGKAEVTAAWWEEHGRPSDVLVRRARLADMVAIARPNVSRSRIRRSPAGENLQAVMLHSGRPILVVPPGWSAEKVDHVAIGWNESLEAARALAMTMPCLHAMNAVTVICSKKREAGAKALLEYLGWHGISADIRSLDTGDESVGESLLNACDKVDAQLLVVGGFSHARARQMLFGGVTRHLLAHSHLLTVMVH